MTVKLGSITAAVQVVSVLVLVVLLTNIDDKCPGNRIDGHPGVVVAIQAVALAAVDLHGWEGGGGVAVSLSEPTIQLMGGKRRKERRGREGRGGGKGFRGGEGRGRGEEGRGRGEEGRGEERRGEERRGEERRGEERRGEERRGEERRGEERRGEEMGGEERRGEERRGEERRGEERRGEERRGEERRGEERAGGKGFRGGEGRGGEERRGEGRGGEGRRGEERRGEERRGEERRGEERRGEERRGEERAWHHLKTRDVMLGEDGEEAGVLVRGDAEVLRGVRAPRVEVEPQEARVLCEVLLPERGGHPEADGQEPRQLLREPWRVSSTDQEAAFLSLGGKG